MTQNKKTTKTTKSAATRTASAKVAAPKKTTTKSTAKKTATVTTRKKVAQKEAVAKPAAVDAPVVQCPGTFSAMKNAVLIVSLIFNLFFLIAWVTLQLTTRYDIELAHFLFIR